MKLNIEKILTELNRLGWTRYRLSTELKVAPSTVYTFLSGAKGGGNHTLVTIDRIADALGVEGKDLII